VSWPGLSRPSTTLAVSAPQVVDGRTKSGHDTGRRPCRESPVLAPMPGAPIGASISRKTPARPLASWPGLSRPSTTLAVSAPQVVDGRTRSGHDTGRRPCRESPVLAPMPGAPIGASISRETPARPFVSWPGLSRPSTTLAVSAPQGVDGRTKSGHDTGRCDDRTKSDHDTGRCPCRQSLC
jgi:hypothetical protein